MGGRKGLQREHPIPSASPSYPKTEKGLRTVISSSSTWAKVSRSEMQCERPMWRWTIPKQALYPLCQPWGGKGGEGPGEATAAPSLRSRDRPISLAQQEHPPHPHPYPRAGSRVHSWECVSPSLRVSGVTPVPGSITGSRRRWVGEAEGAERKAQRLPGPKGSPTQTIPTGLGLPEAGFCVPSEKTKKLVKGKPARRRRENGRTKLGWQRAGRGEG